MPGDGRAPRDLVFFSYSHRDKVWLDRLLIFLKPYVRQGRLSVWADPYIRVGDKWRRDIDVALDRTLIAVLLVSPEFIASDFIDEEELPPLLEAADNGAVTLVPVSVSASPYEITPLKDYQWARDPATPLDKLSKANRNAALVEIVKHIDDLAASVPETLSVEAVAPPVSTKTRPVAEIRASDRLGDLYGVPAQRPHFLPRGEDLDRLRQALFASTHQTVGITGATAGREGRLVGLHGMGGIGKTVMAIALAHDEDVRRAFPDGVLWITLGQQPDFLRLQAELAGYLTGAKPSFASITQGQEALRLQFADKGCLLVVDDLWQAADLEPFDVLGSRSRLLTTTRDASLLTALGAQELVLEVLSRPLAVELLAAWSEQPRDALPEAAPEVAESCGDLPLALSLAGARVRDGAAWEDVLAALRRGDLEFLDHPYGSVFKSLRMSIDALPEDTARRYGELAVFPEDTEVPVSVVRRLWRHTGGLDDGESRGLLRSLERKGLLYLTAEGAGENLSFHDLQRDFLRLIAEDLPALHNQLADAYRGSLSGNTFPRAWSTLPAREPYIWDHLAYHMAGAGLGEELRALLLDYEWIAAKLEATEVQAVIADYALAGDDEALHLLQGTLRLSAHVLAKDPGQLAGQLTGRLRGIGSPELEGLVRGAAHDSNRPWLRPETPSLTPPGGPLLRTLEGHTGGVSAVAVLADGRRALSGSYDNTLRLWDLETGESVRTLEGHTDLVRAVAVLADGRRAVSGSRDKTLRLWDLETGERLRTLEGHTDSVNAVAVVADGRRALSGSDDKTLRLWDLETGESLRTMRGHTDWVTAVAVVADGRRALSGSLDNTLRLWDLDNGETLATFTGDAAITCVAVTRDDLFVAGSANGALHILRLIE